MPEADSALHLLPAGTVLDNRYRVVRSLGEGGFGITYLGHNIVLDRPIAIKEFYPKGYASRVVTQSLAVTIIDTTKNAYFAKWRGRVRDEARMLAKFDNLPGIVNVYDYFEQNATAYIVMEYLDGITLKHYVEKNGPMEMTPFFKSLIPVLRSLSKIHEQGLIHRDISPDNIMLMEDGYLKLYDFGAAKEYSEATQSTYSVVIKPHFAPEEQYRSKGKQGPWTDVYSICATIYYAITGVVPDDSLERVYDDKLKRPSELGVDISPKIENVLLKGMNVRSTDRYDSVIPLVKAFEEAESTPAKKKKKAKANKQPNIFSFFHTSSKQVQPSATPKLVSEHIDEKTELMPNTVYEPGSLDVHNSVESEIKKRPKHDPASTPPPAPIVNDNAVHNEQAASSGSISVATDAEQSAQAVQKAPENLSPKKTEEKASGIICPKCKTVLPNKAKFCGICGIPLQAAASQNSSALASPDKPIAKSPQDTKSENTVKTLNIMCPKCKTILPASAKFCGMCGVKFLTNAANSEA